MYQQSVCEESRSSHQQPSTVSESFSIVICRLTNKSTVCARHAISIYVPCDTYARACRMTSLKLSHAASLHRGSITVMHSTLGCPPPTSQSCSACRTQSGSNHPSTAEVRAHYT